MKQEEEDGSVQDDDSVQGGVDKWIHEITTDPALARHAW